MSVTGRLFLIWCLVWVGLAAGEPIHVEAQVAPQPVTGVVEVAAGGASTCLLAGDGAVRCWGADYNGLGGSVGSAVLHFPALSPLGLRGHVVHMHHTALHYCALLDDGTVRCWGGNLGGEAGANPGQQLVPVVVPITGTVSALDLGYHFTCALVGDAVRCWGLNDVGQLGTGNKTNTKTPVEPIGLGSGVDRIFAGEAFGCARLLGGGFKCWGRNNDSQIGVTSTVTTTALSPMTAVNIPSSVVTLALGFRHACGLTDTGGVKCWGSGLNNGELGNGSKVKSSQPVDVIGLSSGVTVLDAGPNSSCAIQNGNVWCWGSNARNLLGDGSGSTFSAQPVQVVGVSGATAISVGDGHACAVIAGGELRCWGDNNTYRLGDGNLLAAANPPVVVITQLAEIRLPSLLRP